MKTTVKLTLAATALLSASAFAAEDPVLTSFERDLHREVSAHAVRATALQKDLFEEAFRVAMDNQKRPETRQNDTALAGFSTGLGVELRNES